MKLGPHMHIPQQHLAKIFLLVTEYHPGVTCTRSSFKIRLLQRVPTTLYQVKKKKKMSQFQKHLQARNSHQNDDDTCIWFEKLDNLERRQFAGCQHSLPFP